MEHERHQWKVDVLFRPKKGQLDILHDCLMPTRKKETIVLNIFRQYGKSMVMRCVVLDWLTAMDDVVVGYGTPTKRLGREFFRKFQQMLKPLILNANAIDMEIELINHSRLLFFSIESIDHIRGFTLDYLVWDEVAASRQYLPDGSHVYYNIIAPLLDAKGKKQVFISTPRGKHGFFYEQYKKAVEGEPNYKYIEIKINQDETKKKDWINEKKREMTENAFKQEYLCEFLDDGNGLFKGLSDFFTLSVYEEGRKEYVGIDFSTSGADNTILCRVNDLGQVKQHLINGTLDSKYKQIADIINTIDTNMVSCVMEKNSLGEPMINEIKKRLTNFARHKVESFITTNQSKSDIITKLQYLIENAQLTFDKNDKALEEELFSFESKTTPNGLVTYAAPSGGHDDRVMALALATKDFFDNKHKKNREYMAVLKFD